MNGMTVLLLVAVSFLGVLPARVLGDQTMAFTPDDKALLETPALVAAIHHLAEPRPGELLLAGQRLDHVSALVASEYRGVLQYHRAFALARAGNFEQAIALSDKFGTEFAPMPEGLWLNLELSAAGLDEVSSKKRWAIEDRLGLILPVGRWGSLRDARLEEKRAEAANRPPCDAGKPVIPVIDGERLKAIAAQFAGMRMLDEASRATREAIYIGLNPPSFAQRGDETWISADAAPLWHTAAECDAQLGRRGLALQALLMAVASDSAQQNFANDLITKMLESKVEAPASRASADGLKRVIDLYAKSSLHPRALSLLDKTALIPDLEKVSLRASLTKEWAELVGQYNTVVRGGGVLFGQALSEVAAEKLVAPQYDPSAK